MEWVVAYLIVLGQFCMPSERRWKHTKIFGHSSLLPGHDLNLGLTE